MNAPVLTCDAVSLHFGGVSALRDVSFALAPGEIVGLIGPNGAGKSSLINCLTGFYVPQEGVVTVADRDISGLDPRQVALLGVSRTFQQAESLSGMGAADVMMLGRDRFLPSGFAAYAFGWPPARKAERAARQVVEGLAADLGIAEVVRRNTAYENLPYGVRKLVDLGRALACEPEILLMDEPAAGLTSDEKAVMSDVIARIRDTMGIAQLLVDHDLAFVSALAQRLVVLDAGAVIATGPNDVVLADPRVIDSYIGRPDTDTTPLEEHA
ncbi:ABC transporter ATP-binding protein [Aeromicrobium sp.]|uniref:ABC transporter ATP-binding protein n=1 Tax=Aeromicrobium sp. TaxID=1871063 RepID=UPI0025BEB225|nr:ABC transporter ATP-binding protein [Aeromicrobium sp.]MCK5892586.1 ABC transporter ATP-binding protein [Aeromicrobium sp.]